MGKVVLVDTEHSLDPAWAATCGVDVASLFVVQPDTAEQALQTIEMVVRSGDCSAVVLDSISSLAPKAELEGDSGDASMMQVARLMSQAERMLTGIISKTNTCVLFTNQYRGTLPTGFRPVGLPAPRVMPGGNAQKFWASLIVELRRKDGDSTEEYARVVAKIVKNKIGGREDEEALYNLYYDRGIDKVFDLVQVAVDTGVIETTSVGRYAFKEEKYHGLPAVVKAVKEQPDLLKELEERIRQ